MYLETMDELMLKLSERLGFLEKFSFYLSGGTSLSLQIGHRKSFDMDFFTPKDFTPEELTTAIRTHKLTVEKEARRPGTLHCLLEGVKASFIFYDTLLLFPTQKFNSIEIADWRDIVIEKLRVVGDRGQKKDFYDLFFGVQRLEITAIVELAYKKYGQKVNYFHLLKGITYFEEADRNPAPLLYKPISWEEVKNFFLMKVKDFEIAFKQESLL